jgi:hypothetical protein
MRLTQFLKITEAIPVGPRNTKLLLQNRAKDLRYVVAKANAMADKMEQINNNEYGVDTLRDIDNAIQYDLENTYADSVTYWANTQFGNAPLVDKLKVENMLSNVEGILSIEEGSDPGSNYAAKWLGYYIDYAKEAAIQLADIKRLVGQRDEIHRLMTDANLPDDEYPNETYPAKLWLSMLDDLSDIVEPMERVIDAADKFQVILDKRGAFFRGEHQYVPDTEDVETLYHATAYADEIGANGFSAGGREGRRGLGAFGDFNAISFTHDIEIARQIARSLKEMTMIANGQLKARHILSWMRSEGMSDEMIRRYFNSASVDVKDINNIVTVARMYHAYLYATTIRQNPVFASVDSVVTQLRGKDPRDVGIIKAQVDMTDERIEHASGESEWRVPPDAVLSVERY